jgi:hypothetical protein
MCKNGIFEKEMTASLTSKNSGESNHIHILNSSALYDMFHVALQRAVNSPRFGVSFQIIINSPLSSFR